MPFRLAASLAFAGAIFAIVAPSTRAARDAEGRSSRRPRHAVHHVLGTGQSLSLGVSGWPPMTTTQPFDNLMLAREKLAAPVPLVEGLLAPVETMSSSFANHVSMIARTKLGVRHDLLISTHGISGTAYAGLKRGTRAYALGLEQVAFAKQYFGRRGRSYVVTAITNVHGEQDHVTRSASYRDDLLAWQADYERDVRALTGQAEAIPMFQTQMSSFTKYGQATSDIPEAQLLAHLASDGKVVLVGPKYHLRYADDGVHLASEGYRHMGEDYAKAYRRVVLERRRWEPLRPAHVSRTGSTIVLKLRVPVPPLVLDTELVTNPGTFGFSYVDDGSTPEIVSVEVTSPDTVTIALASTPVAPDGRLRYAWAGTPGKSAGRATGARGNLRDSDPTPSRTGHALYNWCIHFDEPVPLAIEEPVAPLHR